MTQSPGAFRAAGIRDAHHSPLRLIVRMLAILIPHVVSAACARGAGHDMEPPHGVR